MSRHLLGLCVCLLAFVSCQSYSEGIKQTKDVAGETVAINALNQLAKAETTYSVSNEGNYGGFEQLAAGDYLDSRFNSSSPVIQGYKLTLRTTAKSGASDQATYACNADPVGEANSAAPHFYIDSTSDGVRVNRTAPASASDPHVQ